MLERAARRSSIQTGAKVVGEPIVGAGWITVVNASDSKEVSRAGPFFETGGCQYVMESLSTAAAAKIRASRDNQRATHDNFGATRDNLHATHDDLCAASDNLCATDDNLHAVDDNRHASDDKDGAPDDKNDATSGGICGSGGDFFLRNTGWMR
jgi:hypothetical protein